MGSSRTVMRSWDALPDVPIRADGPSSEAFRRAGARTFREAARVLHELPYGRNSDRSDYRLVLPEGRGTCSTKHALLAALAAENGIAVRLTVGIYDMTEANTPGVGPVLNAHGLEAIPEAHCYLWYGDERVDLTGSDAAPEAVKVFEREWTIDPSQIGEHKIALHRSYLADWLDRRSDLDVTLDELWTVREACIAALSVG